MMYDLEKASKSASSISLYVSDNPEGSDEVLGPAGAGFPDQEARPVIWKKNKKSFKLQAWQLVQDMIG